MKWMLLLFSVLKPFFGKDHETINPVEEIKDMIRANAMKVVGIFAAASALATIFAAGIIIIAIDVGAQYDQNAYVYFSSMIMMGLLLSVTSLVVGAIIMKSVQSEDKKEKREVLQNVGAAHPLQDALALLISDFVKEREMRRAEEEQLIRSRPQQPVPTTEEIRHH